MDSVNKSLNVNILELRGEVTHLLPHWHCGWGWMGLVFFMAGWSWVSGLISEHVRCKRSDCEGRINTVGQAFWGRHWYWLIFMLQMMITMLFCRPWVNDLRVGIYPQRFYYHCRPDSAGAASYSILVVLVTVCHLFWVCQCTPQGLKDFWKMSNLANAGWVGCSYFRVTFEMKLVTCLIVNMNTQWVRGKRSWCLPKPASFPYLPGYIFPDSHLCAMEEEWGCGGRRGKHKKLICLYLPSSTCLQHGSNAT